MGDYYSGRGRGGYDDGGGYRGGSRGGRSSSGRYNYTDRQGYDDGGRGGGGRGRGYDARGGGNYYHNDGGGGSRAGGRGGYYDNRGFQQQSVGRGGWGYDGGGRGYDGGSRGGRGYEGGRSSSRGRYHNDWGRGGGSRSRQWVRNEREEQQLAPDLQVVTTLEAHTKKLTAICVEPVSQQLYTGSYDGTVKCWSTTTGLCTSSVDVGGEVHSLLIAGGYLFVGIQKGLEGIIRIWDMSSGAHHQLPGHKGEIVTMIIGQGALFSAGADHSIRVWAFNAQASIFMSQAIITKDEGGHDCPVHALQMYGNWMFSADRKGIIKVWDLASGQVVQTLDTNSDPRNKEPVMQLLVWDSYVLSASMNGQIKIWQILDSGAPGVVLKTEPEFCFDKNSEGDQQQTRRPRGPTSHDGIVTMQGTLDAAGTPVLMVVFMNEDCVRLYELPSFQSRGVMCPTPETRSVGMMLTPEGKGQIVMSGDNAGKLHIFSWKPPVVAGTPM